MKKSRFLGLSILTVIIQLLFCGSAFAKNVYKVIALKPNVSVTQRKNDTKKTDDGTSRTVYYYKAVAPSEGYFTVTVKKGLSKNNAQLKIYNDLGPKPIGNFKDKQDVVRVLPVSKGALYFRASSGNTIDYKFTKVVQKNNYCRAKALPLKKGKKETVCQTPKYNYVRWFKINLTKKQKITLYCSGRSHASIFDDGLNSVHSSSISTSNTMWAIERTEKKMPKGSYYICTDEAAPLYHDGFGYYACSLYWK